MLKPASFWALVWSEKLKARRVLKSPTYALTVNDPEAAVLKAIEHSCVVALCRTTVYRKRLVIHTASAQRTFTPAQKEACLPRIFRSAEGPPGKSLWRETCAVRRESRHIQDAGPDNLSAPA